MKLTICGPNLEDQSKGQFHVHAAGCADLKRSREPEYRNGWTTSASDRVEVCDEVYPPEDFGCQSGDYVGEFHFFPCCATLPVHAEPPVILRARTFIDYTEVGV